MAAVVWIFVDSGGAGKFRIRPFSAASVTGLHGVQGTTREYKQSMAIAAAEQQLRGPLWNVDGIDQIACWVVDEHLPRGDIDVALLVYGHAFSAAIGEKPHVRDRSVVANNADVGFLSGFIGEVVGLALDCGCQAKCSQQIVQFSPIVQLPGDEVFSCGQESASVRRNKLVMLFDGDLFEEIVLISPVPCGQDRGHSRAWLRWNGW